METNMAKAKDMPQMTDGTQDEDVGSILEYSVDISQQERPPVLPPGEYLATLVGIEKKFGKESGRPYINVRFSVLPENQPIEFVESMGTNQAITLFYMFQGAEDTPPGRWAMAEFCRAMQAPMSDRVNPKDFLNLEARVGVEHQNDFEGNPQARIRRVMKA